MVESCKTLLGVLVVFLFYLTTVTGQSITIPPQNATGKIGGTVKFHCTVEFGTIRTMSWNFNNNPIYIYQYGHADYPKSNKKYEVTKKGNTFIMAVNNLEYQDGGLFTCLIESDMVMKTAVLIVLDTPKIRRPLDTPPQRGMIMYICEAWFGGPPIHYIAHNHYPHMKISSNKDIHGDVILHLESKHHRNYHLIIGRVLIPLKASMNGVQLNCEIRTHNPMFAVTDTKIPIIDFVDNNVQTTSDNLILVTKITENVSYSSESFTEYWKMVVGLAVPVCFVIMILLFCTRHYKKSNKQQKQVCSDIKDMTQKKTCTQSQNENGIMDSNKDEININLDEEMGAAAETCNSTKDFGPVIIQYSEDDSTTEQTSETVGYPNTVFNANTRITIKSASGVFLFLMMITLTILGVLRCRKNQQKTDENFYSYIDADISIEPNCLGEHAPNLPSPRDLKEATKADTKRYSLVLHLKMINKLSSLAEKEHSDIVQHEKPQLMKLSCEINAEGGRKNDKEKSITLLTPVNCSDATEVDEDRESKTSDEPHDYLELIGDDEPMNDETEDQQHMEETSDTSSTLNNYTSLCPVEMSGDVVEHHNENEYIVLRSTKSNENCGAIHECDTEEDAGLAEPHDYLELIGDPEGSGQVYDGIQINEEEDDLDEYNDVCNDANEHVSSNIVIDDLPGDETESACPLQGDEACNTPEDTTERNAAKNQTFPGNHDDSKGTCDCKDLQTGIASACKIQGTNADQEGLKCSKNTVEDNHSWIGNITDDKSSQKCLVDQVYNEDTVNNEEEKESDAVQDCPEEHDHSPQPVANETADQSLSVFSVL